VKEGQAILDVGAGLGAYTLLFAKLAQDTGQIHAFEPNPKAFGILRDNVERNGLTNTHISEFGISNSIGKAQLKAHGPGGLDGSTSTLITPEGQKATGEIRIETTTIDSYCQENDIHPDGIKIDVEGAEGLVIEGARATIAKCSPWILLEFHGHLMSQKDRETCWHRVVDSAKELTFICGETNQYKYGDKVASIPDCLYFHVLIKY
jgi:FkbM family methyltransferase